MSYVGSELYRTSCLNTEIVQSNRNSLLIAPNPLKTPRCQYLPCLLCSRDTWITKPPISCTGSSVALSSSQRAHRGTRFRKGSLQFLICLQDLFNETNTHRPAKSPITFPSCSCAACKLYAKRTIITFLFLTCAYSPSGLLRLFIKIQASADTAGTACFGWGRPPPQKI